jgi:PBP1b-binding outer membrane lipoprotein LpoB
MKILRTILAAAVLVAFAGCTDANPAPKKSTTGTNTTAPAKTDSC